MSRRVPDMPSIPALFNLAKDDRAEEESDLPDLEDNETSGPIPKRTPRRTKCGDVPAVMGMSSTWTASGDGAVYGEEAWSTTGWTSLLTGRRLMVKASGIMFVTALHLPARPLQVLQADLRRAAHQLRLRAVRWADAAGDGDDEPEQTHQVEKTTRSPLSGPSLRT